MDTKSTNIKRDYRRSQIIIDFDEREDLKERAYNLFERGQVSIANILKTSPSNVNMAFKGKSMRLMSKIKSLIITYETRKEQIPAEKLIETK